MADFPCLVTWDASYFNSSVNTIFVQAEFGLTIDDDTVNGFEGFTSEALDPASGSYSWTILESYLEGNERVEAKLYLATNSDAQTKDETRFPGPAVGIGPATAPSGPNKAAIAVPVVFGVIALAFIAVYLYKRRRNPDFKLRHMFTGSKGNGYGVGQSRANRMGTDVTSVRMDAMGPDTRPVPGSGNVFREEMRRQEQAR